MKKIIFLFLVVSSAGFSQSDSLSLEKKWEKSHSVGVELGGKLFFYALNYELRLNRDKSNFGIGYGLNFYKTPYSPVQGNTIFFKYLYGLKNQFFIEFGQSLFIQTEGFNDDFNGNIWEKPQPLTLHNSLSIGYNFVLNKKLSVFASPMLIYGYGKKYDYAGELKKYSGFIPYFNVGFNIVL